MTNSTDQVNELVGALAKARPNFGEIKRTKVVTVRPRDKTPYTFAYAPLENIVSAVTGPLAQEGLILSQATVESPSSGARFLRTTLYHASGQAMWIDVPLVLPDAYGMQGYGSALTYAARYGVGRLLCLATEEDDDGNSADGNEATVIKDSGKTAEEKSEVMVKLEAATQDGTKRLAEVWMALTSDERNAISNDEQIALSAAAKKVDRAKKGEKK